jgi:hypothetical protein
LFGVLRESGVVWSFSFPRSKAVVDDVFRTRREDVVDRLDDLLKLSGTAFKHLACESLF